MTAPEPFTAEQLDCLERFARSSPRVAIEGATLLHLIAQAREEIRLRAMLDGQTFVLTGPPEDPSARAKRELGEWLAANSYRSWGLFGYDGSFRVVLFADGGTTVVAGSDRCVTEHEAITAALRAAKGER